MPVCPRCGVAYLDTETHACARRTSLLLVFAMGAIGLIVGGAVGGQGLATYCVAVGTPCGEGALMTGVPFGALGGAALAMYAARIIDPKAKR